MDRVIVIHGVGGSIPGKVAGEVASSIGLSKGSVNSVWSLGREFVEIVDANGKQSVLEVNWSDLNPTTKTLGVLRYLVYIVTSMVDLTIGSGNRSAHLYRALLFTVGPGSVLFGLAVATAFVVEEASLRRLILISATLVLSVLIIYLRSLGSYIHFLWPWVVGVAAIAMLAFLHPLAMDGRVVQIAQAARKFGFLSVILALNAAAMEALYRLRLRPLPEKLAQLALLYTPYLVVNGITTWTVFLSFAWFSRFAGRYTELDRISTPPGLEQFERSATITIAILATLVLLVPIILYFRGANPKSAPVNRRGRGAQNGFLCVLGIAPIALVILELVVARILVIKPPTQGILAVYGTSVLRTLPVAGWLVGPFSVALRVIADILFYLQPNPKSPAAIANECKARLRAAISCCARIPTDSAVVVAHSQGTVIAVDLRQRGELQFPLLTLGSPVRSLYCRFLGIDLLRGQQRESPWLNAYRDGDYIAGPLNCSAAHDKCVGAGGHVGYWPDQSFRELLEELRASSALASP